MTEVQPAPAILVVEDEWLIAREITVILQRLGHAVCGPASNGAEALRLVEAEAPDAALLDISLDTEDSFGVAKQLDALGIPYAFITGFLAADLPAAMAGRMVIPKPASEAALAAALDVLLPGRPTG